MPLMSHRGAAHLKKANSKAAIEVGDSYHPDYIEIDINVTSDGLLVVHHGELSRFLRGKCMKETYAEIKKKVPHIVPLDELKNIRTHSPYIFDIKSVNEDSLDRIVSMIKKQGHKNFAFTSPHEKALVAMSKAFPKSDIFQSQPYHHGPIAALELARKNGFSGIALNKWWLTPLVYNLCKLHGKKVMVYTIDQAWWLKMAHMFYPGAYIVTNRPDLYRKLFPTD